MKRMNPDGILTTHEERVAQLDRALANPVPVPVRHTTLPTDSGTRKEIPIHSGVIRYFPAALVAVAQISKFGNDKHNPGQPLHHSRGKSMDHKDCIVRHLIDAEEVPYDENGLPELAYLAWRALAALQEFLEENEGVPMAPGAGYDE
jgi:hypothetical protein